jgi:ABC-type phosphate/phosphonate transport system substrate-binding protein
MHEDKKGREILDTFGAKMFIETTRQDYEPVFTYADRIKLDLKKYDYIND